MNEKTSLEEAAAKCMELHGLIDEAIAETGSSDGLVEALQGVTGGKFVLKEELTWELFDEVLYSMPGGKAVGKGGFHAEILRAAGEKARRAFYEALLGLHQELPT